MGAGSERQLIAQISDPHIGYGAGPRDPERALAEAVTAIGELAPLPVAVIVSGDLTNNGTAGEYRTLRELLAPLPMPVHPLAGNHDDRAELRKAFADHRELAAAPGEFVNYVADCGPLRLIACDSTVPGEVPGALGPERLAWIEARLDENRDRRSILALHHPPFLTGLDGFDEIGLPAADRDALASLLAASDGVERVVCGHVHRSVTVALGGVTAMICPSVHLAADPDFSAAGRVALKDAQPAIAVHVLEPRQGMVTHIHPIGQPS